MSLVLALQNHLALFVTSETKMISVIFAIAVTSEAHPYQPTDFSAVLTLPFAHHRAGKDLRSHLWPKDPDVLFLASLH